MKRRAFLRSGAAGAGLALAGCLQGDGPGGDGGQPRLSVDGRWLVDPDGNRVVLRGINVVDPWWGQEYADLRGKDYWETVELALDRDAGWQTHVVRFPIEQRTIDAVGYDRLVEEYLDRAVDLTREAGAYAILDFHAVNRYDTASIDRRIRDFWSTVAPRYADETHVLYELFNEPTEPGQEGVESWRTWRETATPWLEMVREEAPETPVIVGSPRWSSMARYAATDPFADDNVVYSAHIFPSWNEETWAPRFGTAALEVPLFVTEWGYVDVRNDDTEPHMIGSTGGWGEPFRAWLDRHEHVSWAAWCFDSVWMPRMFDTDWTLLSGDQYMGGFTKRWLAETADRHWPPGRADGTTPTTDGAPPSAPANLRVTERRATSVTVAWDPATDPDDDVTQYRVALDGERRHVLQRTTREATLTALSPGEEYTVTVVAVDGRGVISETAASRTVSTDSNTEPVATIPQAATAPTIDGTAGEPWAEAPTHAVENVLIEPPAEADELAGEWQALWDETAIYFHVAVTDPEKNVDSDAKYHDDNVEVYLDPDFSRGRSYDGENDAQFLVRRGEDRVYPGANSVTYDGIAVATAETDEGWAAELAIPWPDGVTPETGKRVGTDVHVTDDVDGGDRDAKLAWYATTDQSWQRPDTFAIVTLGE